MNQYPGKYRYRQGPGGGGGGDGGPPASLEQTRHAMQGLSERDRKQLLVIALRSIRYLASYSREGMSAAALAEEIYQEAFLRLWSGRHRWKPGKVSIFWAFKGSMDAIISQELTRLHRLAPLEEDHESSKDRSPAPGARPQPLAGAVTSTEETVESLDWVLKFLDSLKSEPSLYRIAKGLYEGVSKQALAEQERCSNATITKRTQQLAQRYAAFYQQEKEHH